ncbi:MAG: ABC transporter permease [Candidatus Cloacimonetes bacterium]|nr:ABC transporter permease [Candidatus Cloacimonadota bacterium]
MSGQIIAGMNPVTAIKYQAMIMIAILSTVSLTIYLALKLLEIKAFDKIYLPGKIILNNKEEQN